MDSYSYYSTTTTYFSSGNQSPHSNSRIDIPISSPSSETQTTIPVHNPAAEAAAAIKKIQSVFRSHLTRSQVNRIKSINSEANRLERLIRQQHTVDAIRRDKSERLRMSESLMRVLLRLDAIPGYYPAVRELRRSVSRRIVGIQEVLDAIIAAPEICGDVEEQNRMIPGSLDELVAGVWSGSEVQQEQEEEEEATRITISPCWERFLWGV